MRGGTLIGAWFVSDSAAEGTFFPQIGGRSDAPESKAVYWRCTLVYYASSIVVNPDANHVFFTNADLPIIDGVDVAAVFEHWGVEVVTLPITYRLPKGSVGSWGNQFYIFDVIDYLAATRIYDRAIILDSDCVWRKSASALEADIDAKGAVTYLLDGVEHAEGSLINGLSREGMARFLAAQGGPVRACTPYYGGEFYAARQDISEHISAQAKALWPLVLQQGPDAPREEAHFLSILYALIGVENALGNNYIRRMWTTFHHNNLRSADTELAVWHLPAEKKTGFRDLFAQVTEDAERHPARDAEAMGLSLSNYARIMGHPRRRPAKFARDLSQKIAEKLKA